jgi:hypothetical protein
MSNSTDVDSSGNNHLQQDEVVQALVSDPSNPPETKMLIGLVGESSQEGFSRLYLSTNLSDYVEISEDDVLWSKSLQTPENPLGGTAIWVRADANLTVTRRVAAEREQVSAEPPAAAAAPERFLTGSITARFFTGASASVASSGRLSTGTGGGGGGGLKSVPPVESCVPSLCLPPPPKPDPPGHTAVCTLATNCSVVVF